MKGLVAMEAAMSNFYEQHKSEAGVGLQLLPGVANVLQALKVGARAAAGNPHKRLTEAQNQFMLTRNAGSQGRCFWLSDWQFGDHWMGKDECAGHFARLQPTSLRGLWE